MFAPGQAPVVPQPRVATVPGAGCQIVKVK